tara:strand:- start:28 stop:801 length:774 start_codon:yes stop_codon:yes gene_type:complete
MVSIDTVYQKVLMLANKEQRGYITPQEFNLFADQSQKEIFEQYFYDLNVLTRKPSNTKEYSDVVDNINEKVAIFEKFDNPCVTASVVGQHNVGVIATSFPMYRLGTLIYEDIDTVTTPAQPQFISVEIEEVQPNEILAINNSPLIKPDKKHPVYTRKYNNQVNLYPMYGFPNTVTSTTGSISCTYTTPPTKPSWGYVVVNQKALYDPTNTTNFDLHEAEESELIYKILKLSGAAIKRDDVLKAATSLEVQEITQQKQ